jgi:hypothetical protein
MSHEGNFIFESYEASVEEGSASFHYRVDLPEQSYTFTEHLNFPPPTRANLSAEIITPIFNALFLLGGISYWKLWCPRRIQLPTIELTPQQADFWNIVYSKGLGELFYKNQINFWDLVQFPSLGIQAAPATALPLQERSLLMIGGGKDSVVSAELLKKSRQPFATFTLNAQPVQEAVIKQIGGQTFNVVRTLDPQLIELNGQAKTYSGHIPISAFYGLTALLVAALHDYRYVIASNERSANYGNVEYLGATINHQWSKSFEFENLFQNYIHEFISPDLTYFSILRPLSEIKIGQLFADQAKYFSFFSSCNVNFRQTQSSNLSLWCGDCAKCAFVFVTLAAWLPKEQLIKMFGRNFLAEDNLLQTYRELLGLGPVKPFDCVGTPEEVALAFALIKERGEYQQDAALKMYEQETGGRFPSTEELKKTLLAPTVYPTMPDKFSKLLTTT